jgi:hypothetical protein
LGKFVSIIVNPKKKAQQTTKLRKKEKEKENTGTEVYICAL